MTVSRVSMGEEVVNDSEEGVYDDEEVVDDGKGSV